MDFIMISKVAILILIIQLSSSCIFVSGKRSCLTSLGTVRLVMRCPTNLEAWQEREKLKNCSSLKQNCTSSELFMYHCIPNAWQNGFVEVCAIKTIITGKKCPEFNYGGKMVQEHYKGNCLSCPFHYNSTDAFKHKECFDLAKNNSFPVRNTTNSSYQPNSTTSESSSDCLGLGCTEVMLTLVVFLSAAFLIILLIIFWKCCGKCNQKKNNSKKTDFHDTPHIPRKQEKICAHEDEELIFIDDRDKRIRVDPFSGFSPQENVEDLANASFFYGGYSS